MEQIIIHTTQDSSPTRFYIVGDIINLERHTFKQKIELRAYSLNDDKLMGQCDFAISKKDVGNLCYIGVKHEYMHKHIGTALIECMHDYLAKNQVKSVSGMFGPEPQQKWAAEAFYRKHHYAIMFDEYIFRKITNQDLLNKEVATWRTSTIRPECMLQPLEEITVNPIIGFNDETNLILKK